jgi:hypothetical protein
MKILGASHTLGWQGSAREPRMSSSSFLCPQHTIAADSRSARYELSGQRPPALP